MQTTLNNKDDLLEKVYSKIMYFMAHKERTEFEVERKFDFILKNYALSSSRREELKNQTLQSLRESKLLDDERYAETYVKQQVNGIKAVSRRKVVDFLRKKGVPVNIIEECVVDFDEEVEFRNALKLGKTRKGKDLYRYLASKGFSSDVIRGVVDTLAEVK